MRARGTGFRAAPATDAVLGYLRDVVPPSALVPLDTSLRNALQHGRHDAAMSVVSRSSVRRGRSGPHHAR
jgi:hypothetical protein